MSTKQEKEKVISAHINQNNTMKKGTVKWYDETKGFGFISTQEGNDIFVHRSGLYSSFGGLQPEQEVTFDTKEGDKGSYAVNVKSA